MTARHGRTLQRSLGPVLRTVLRPSLWPSLGSALRHASGLALLVAAAFTCQSGSAQEPSVPTPASSPLPATTPPTPPSSLPAGSSPETAASAAAVSAGAPLPTPIAIVTTQGLTLTGAVDLADGKAVIPYGGSITAGEHATTVNLPRRGSLRICPTTRVSLTSDASIAAHLPANESPGLMLSLDRGAIEATMTTGRNSDVILTPDFRIIISGPGKASVQVRLGDKGDTCVDNRGPDAPYVSVTSIFDGGLYRVQADQRVMFQHGSLNEVIDREKESCGCPPEAATTEAIAKKPNEFPVAQSEGLAPLPAPPPNALQKGVVQAQATANLNYDANRPGQVQAAVTTAPSYTVPPKPGKGKSSDKPRTGFFHSIGRFFRGFFLG